MSRSVLQLPFLTVAPLFMILPLLPSVAWSESVYDYVDDEATVQEKTVGDTRKVEMDFRMIQTEPYRHYPTVPWCVTGRDESQLHRWPLNQFIPLLRRSLVYRSDLTNFKYKMDFNEVKSTQYGTLSKRVHVIFNSYARRHPQHGISEKWLPGPLEGLLVQAHHNPRGLGLPTGQFGRSSLYCTDCDMFWERSVPCSKRASLEAIPPNLLTFHHLLMRPPRENDTVGRGVAGRRSEIHTNFVFHSPACGEAKRLEFLIMAVRSFQDWDYDVLRLGPYEVTRDPVSKSWIRIPPPYFQDSLDQIICHGRPSKEVVLGPPGLYPPFKMSQQFAACLQNEPPDGTPFCDGSNLLIATGICRNIQSPQCPDNPTLLESELLDIDCPTCPLPTQNQSFFVDSSTRCDVGQRTVHGFLMIWGNYFVFLYVMFIGRFGKETLNQYNWRGNKPWLWIHMIGGILGLLMVYFGHFSPVYVKSSLIHVIVGYVYCAALGLCYCISWLRHDNRIIHLAFTAIHALSGYAAIILATVSLFYAPKCGWVPKIASAIACGIFVIFFGVMTGHVCCLDKLFGMKPSRRHFLTLEARFDQVPVPKSDFRLTIFIIFLLILFGLSLASTLAE